MCFVCSHVVHPYNSMDTSTAWMRSHFILSDRSDFDMIDNLSIAVHAFTWHTLTLLSVDETRLTRYVNLSTNFSGEPLRVNMAPFLLKHILCFICVHVEANPAGFQLWSTPTYGRAKAGRPAWTYIQQLCEDTGCSPEDLPEAMNDREKGRERVRDICACGTTWWWWYIYIFEVHTISF